MMFVGCFYVLQNQNLRKTRFVFAFYFDMKEKSLTFAPHNLCAINLSVIP